LLEFTGLLGDRSLKVGSCLALGSGSSLSIESTGLGVLLWIVAVEWLGLSLSLDNGHGNLKRRTAVAKRHIGPVGFPNDFLIGQPL